MTKDQIVAALPKLSKTDLEVIHGLTGHLLGAAGLPLTPIGQAFINALLTATGQPKGYISPVAASQRRAFETRAGHLAAFLNENFKGWDDNKTTQHAFLTELFRLLADDLKNRGVKPTLGVMIINMKRIPEVFDNAFPLYRESGLGHVILAKFK
jgi:hypothetical protein